nr:MAG TPA: hypothetical protein [Caudoviricetes sp.]
MYFYSLCNSNNEKVIYLLSIGQVAQKCFYLLFYLLYLLKSCAALPWKEA